MHDSISIQEPILKLKKRPKDGALFPQPNEPASELEHAVKPQIKLKNVRVAVDLDELSRFP